jgi:hypothetical protein
MLFDKFGFPTGSEILEQPGPRLQSGPRDDFLEGCPAVGVHPTRRSHCRLAELFIDDIHRAVRSPVHRMSPGSNWQRPREFSCSPCKQIVQSLSVLSRIDFSNTDSNIWISPQFGHVESRRFPQQLKFGRSRQYNRRWVSIQSRALIGANHAVRALVCRQSALVARSAYSAPDDGL